MTLQKKRVKFQTLVHKSFPSVSVQQHSNIDKSVEFERETETEIKEWAMIFK